jgi:hypothetical protein
MSRPLRIEFPGAVYHVSAHGNRDQAIFSSENDRKIFLKNLAECSIKYGIHLYAYVLLDSTFRIVFETPAANLKGFMHSVLARYTIGYNRRNGVTGHLFEGRYQAVVMDKEEYLMPVSRFLHVCAVRQGLATAPEDWQWSSYANYIHTETAQTSIVKPAAILDMLNPNAAAAIREYRTYVESADVFSLKDPLAGAVGNAVLGGDAFAHRVRTLVDEQYPGIEAEDIPALKKIGQWSRGEAEEALRVIAGHFGVTMEALQQKKRKYNWPRDVAVRVFFNNSLWTLGRIGDFFLISYSAVSKAVSRVNEKMEKSSYLAREIETLEKIFSENKSNGSI